jgi:hypothetical protein
MVSRSLCWDWKRSTGHAQKLGRGSAVFSFLVDWSSLDGRPKEADRSRRRRRCRRHSAPASSRLPYLLPLLLDKEHVDRQVLEIARQRACLECLL